MADQLSRRRFLKGTAVGLSGLGVIAAAPSWAFKDGQQPASDVESEEPGPTVSGPLVAYVRDAAKGEVVLMVGTREVVRTDRRLVSRLVQCCKV